MSIVKHLFVEQGNVGRLEDFVLMCQLKRTQLRAGPVQLIEDQFQSTCVEAIVSISYDNTVRAKVIDEFQERFTSGLTQSLFKAVLTEFFWLLENTTLT